MESGNSNHEFESFHGGILEDWNGMLSVNGTMEGFIKLGSHEA